VARKQESHERTRKSIKEESGKSATEGTEKIKRRKLQIYTDKADFAA
jgi:hypothetical protein